MSTVSRKTDPGRMPKRWAGVNRSCPSYRIMLNGFWPEQAAFGKHSVVTLCPGHKEQFVVSSLCSHTRAANIRSNALGMFMRLPKNFPFLAVLAPVLLLGTATCKFINFTF